MAISAEYNYADDGQSFCRLKWMGTVGVKYYKGQIVAIGTTGLAIIPTDATTVRPNFAVVVKTVDCTTESKPIDVEKGKFWFPVSSAQEAYNGRWCYSVDGINGITFSTSNAPPCGKIVGFRAGQTGFPSYNCIDFAISMPKLGVS